MGQENSMTSWKRKTTKMFDRNPIYYSTFREGKKDQIIDIIKRDRLRGNNINKMCKINDSLCMIG